MKDSILADIIYDKINLDRNFESCYHTLDSNTIEITDKQNSKSIVTIGEPKSIAKLRAWANKELLTIGNLKDDKSNTSPELGREILAREGSAQIVLKLIGN